MHFRGCSCPNCTYRVVRLLLGWCTSCSGKRQSRAETSAPPGLLHEQLLYLAVGSAHDVDATLKVLYAYSAEVVYLDIGVVAGSG